MIALDNWLDITTMDEASKGITVKFNSLTGERVEEQKLTEIEPITDSEGKKWRQFRPAIIGVDLATCPDYAVEHKSITE